MVRPVGVLLALTALALSSGCCKRWCCRPVCCPPACCSPCCSPCCDGVSFYPPAGVETAPPPMPLPAGGK
jgi:hypothetical protein